MRKVILYIAASIDGFIARENGEIDWLENPNYHIEGESFGYDEFYDSIDTTLMGNQTYRQVLGFDVPFPYPDKTNYVFSRSKSGHDEHVQFINSDIPDLIAALKKEEGRDIWLVGGSQINGPLLSQGLIDKIILTLIPVTLGTGIPLFSGSGQIDNHFRLEDSKTYKNGFVQLTYNKKG